MGEFHGLAEFVADLFGGTEEVGVVLGEAADACEAGEFAGLFVAVDGAEFGEAEGEVAVAAGLGCEDLGVVGAVHGFEEVFFGDTAFFDVGDALGGVALPVVAFVDVGGGEERFLGGVVDGASFEGGDECHGGVVEHAQGGELGVAVVRVVP